MTEDLKTRALAFYEANKKLVIYVAIAFVLGAIIF